MQFAGPVPLVTLHRPKRGSSRTAVDIGRRVVSEVLLGEAALRRQAVETFSE